MADEKLIDGYDVTVRGTYYAISGKDKSLKSFGPVTFFLPEHVQIPNGKKKLEKVVNGRKVIVLEQQIAKRSVTAENIALYVIQRRLLPTWLAENHPDAGTFRTCHLVPGAMKRARHPTSHAVNLDKAVKEMSMQELQAFCRLQDLNTPVNNYGSIQDARAAVAYDLAEQKKKLAGARPVVALRVPLPPQPVLTSGPDDGNVVDETYDPGADQNILGEAADSNPDESGEDAAADLLG